jgi:hypothetical protein
MIDKINIDQIIDDIKQALIDYVESGLINGRFNFEDNYKSIKSQCLNCLSEEKTSRYDCNFIWIAIRSGLKSNPKYKIYKEFIFLNHKGNYFKERLTWYKIRNANVYDEVPFEKYEIDKDYFKEQQKYFDHIPDSNEHAIDIPKNGIRFNQLVVIAGINKFLQFDGNVTKSQNPQIKPDDKLTDSKLEQLESNIKDNIDWRKLHKKLTSGDSPYFDKDTDKKSFLFAFGSPDEIDKYIPLLWTKKQSRSKKVAIRAFLDLLYLLDIDYESLRIRNIIPKLISITNESITNEMTILPKHYNKKKHFKKIDTSEYYQDLQSIVKECKTH